LNLPCGDLPAGHALDCREQLRSIFSYICWQLYICANFTKCCKNNLNF
jgi:hypothetical protein